MDIQLFEHNEKAYMKALAMLNEKGKAAVIHPTGTGKSFIGFKLCAENKYKTICWLSPSEYIYNTQLSNLKEVSDGYEPSNIKFYTYAKLSYMSLSDIEEINPDYIILDEFHRCGAEVWGLGVYRLLSVYDKVPVLGLSATAIRYLDNQRDMADELFDGNVASEMSLGEAIVRGILNPPKYILSIFSYRDSLAKYEDKVKRMRSKVLKNKAEEYLEALRRALDMADGLDVIFDKHMKDRDGKYIVFCANYEAMQEAIDKAGEWFGKVDKNPHIYLVYSDDPLASVSFNKFKADNETGHLRLLFCIDALNEGVHVENVSGVILLRPTVSPIVYKQQIGRALSASKSTEPVIFDIVNNIENLYSIDAIKDEMDEAVNYIRFHDDEDSIVNESFKVIDEVRNCMELFDSLENTLTYTWDTMYIEAKQFYENNGNLKMTYNYVTESGYPLGRWLGTQRSNRHKGDTSLTEERIEKLDAIGMVWDYAEDVSWKQGYNAACAYYQSNGNLNISASYITEDGFKLGNWFRHIKDKYEEGRLEDRYVEMLEEIGIQWGAVYTNRWIEKYEEAKKYYQEKGDLIVPYDYITDNNTHLGVWVSAQRDNYAKKRLTAEQISLLEELNMSWDRFKSKWDAAFQKAEEYYDENGNINNIPADYRPDGIKLLNWIRTQRSSYNNGKLTQERIEKLESLDIIWNPQDALWDMGYQHALDYVNEHGDLNVPPGYICADGYKLKGWLINQGTRNKTGRMSDEQREKLIGLGMKF